MGHGQQSAFTLKYRDSHNGSHSPLTFFANRGLLMWMSHFDYPSSPVVIKRIPA